MPIKPVDILYVEDDVMDVDIAKTALGLVCEPHLYNMAVMEDGEKAVKFIENPENPSGSPRPDLILLDLNLPKVHGREVLRKIKGSKDYKNVPVIVLSTSRVQRDIDETYELGACAYLTKPNELDGYKETFKAICDFWFKKVKFLGKGPAAAFQ